MTKKTLELDLSRNRLGDCWMVLSALATAAALRPEYVIRCSVPAELKSLAKCAFAERLEMAEAVGPGAPIWSHVGLRGMLPGVLTGRRYVAPYPHIVSHVRKLGGWKNNLNHSLLEAFNRAGRIFVPPQSSLEHYIGYIQLVCLPRFRAIAWEDFLRQAGADHQLFRDRLLTAGAAIPPVAAARGRVLVFSSGVSQQSMPPEWAKANLPEALFCFHRENSQAAAFRAAGLETLNFETPEEIIRLALDARWIVATDSFPSHVLQLVSDRVTLCLTQELGKRVVSPCFRGTVIESTAVCAPCAGPNPDPLLCRLGYRYCLSWGEKQYAGRILASIG